MNKVGASQIAVFEIVQSPKNVWGPFESNNLAPLTLTGSSRKIYIKSDESQNSEEENHMKRNSLHANNNETKSFYCFV